MKKFFLLHIFVLISGILIFANAPLPCAAATISSSDIGSAVSGSDADSLYSDEYNQVSTAAVAYDDQSIKVARARVLEVISDYKNEYDAIGEYMCTRVQTLKVKVLSGIYRGRIVTIEYDISDPLTTDGSYELEPAEVGDVVLVQLTVDANGLMTGYVTEFGRDESLMWLGIVFLLLLIIFGGARGIRSIIALLTICIGLIFIMIPLILNGVSAIWAAIFGCIFSVIVTLLVVYGLTKKTFAAALGASGGLLIAGCLSALMNWIMKMTGLMDEDWVFLALSMDGNSTNLRGILFASVLISVLGGTIDVGVSIASALEELHDKAPDIQGAQLLTSGINIGIDIMGASLNTLILSYVGGSIPIIMLCGTYNIQIIEIINKELIANEILRALAGSYGLFFTVPITSIIAAMLLCGGSGNWGHFSADCFGSVVLAKRLWAKLTSYQRSLTSAIKSLAKKSAAEQAAQENYSQPVNLYETARLHREALEQEYGSGDQEDAPSKRS